MNSNSPPTSHSGGNSTALDQWRGLALVFVLISHGFFFTDRVNGIGRVGVNLFFFISGVLVFKSLTGHRDATAWGRTIHFWRRRLRRLYPALAAYALAMIPIVYLLRNVPGAIGPSMYDYLRGLPFALIYGINYGPSNSAMSLGHLWSVACEMQFYLLGPIIFLLGGKAAAKRNFVWGILLLLFVASGFIGAMLDKEGRYKYHFEIAVWPMMLGFCCEYRKDLFQRIPAKWFHAIILTSVIAFGVMTALMFCGMEMKKPVIAIGTLAFVPCFLAYIGNRVLGGPVGRTMTWLGERTYSIYLWQQPFTICNYLPNALHPAGAIVATFMGGIWFKFFERPFLSSKRQQVTAAPKFPRKKNYFRLFALVIFIALALTVSLAFVARKQYADSLAAKVFPANGFALPKLENTKPADILLLGDSRIAGWDISQINSNRVFNAGFGGITTAQLAMDCESILQQTHPKIVVIQAGINDLKLLGVRPDLRQQVISNCVANILTIVQQSKQIGARVIVTTIWPAGKVSLLRRFVWSSDVNSAVAETNLRLQHALESEPDAMVVDFFGETTQGLSDTDREKLYSDTLHLKPETYSRLTELLAEKIKAPGK